MAKASESMPVILAAGGLLWKRTLTGNKIALVHRRRYGDWTLPKGKLNSNEQPIDAALREVKEEVGCEATILDFAGTVTYRVDGAPKVVLFWHMNPQGECSFSPSEEVDRVEWFAPKEAVSRMSYEAERSLIVHKTLRRKSKVLSMLSRDGEPRRLAATLTVYRQLFERRLESGNLATAGWAKAGKQLLDHSASALAENNIDEGWRALLAAERMEVFGMSPAELQAKAKAVHIEAMAKLSSWRKSAIEALDLENPSVSASAIEHAMSIVHDHFHNVYHKIRLVRDQLAWLGIILFVLVLLMFLLNVMGWIIIEETSTLAGVLLFGALGGAFSAALSLGRTSVFFSIPEQFLNVFVTLSRPVIGATGGLVAYVLLRAGVIPFKEVSQFFVLAVAFSAGFTERWVVKKIESIAK
jgi:8-oxo-dGTP pyrophosphatase MutT (NUDIX family)